MTRSLLPWASGLLALASSACAAASPTPANSAGETPGAAAPPATSEGEVPASEGPAPAGSAGEAPPATTSTPLAPSAPLFHDHPADPTRSLPAISVRHVGMHIGGGSNSAEEKRPFLKTLEVIETELLVCYRQVERPLAGGTYGVDLLVPLSGGHPEVKGSRQKLGGPSFVACMERVFASARFPAPPRATMVSYSLRFDVTEPARR